MSDNGLFRVGFAKSGRQFDDERVRRALRQLADIDNNKAIIGGLRAAGGFLRSRLQGFIVQHYIGLRLFGRAFEGSPTRTPSLHSSIRNTYKRGKAGTLRYVGFARRGGEHGALAHLYDRGTAERWQQRTGRYTGRMPRTDFVDRVIASSGGGMMSRLSQGISRALSDAARGNGGT